MGMFERMKERRLFQIVAAYLAAGWIGLEVFDQLVDREVLPRVVYTIALAWFAAGIVVAVLVGWYHGEKGKQKAPVQEIVTIAVVALAVLGFSGSSAYDYWSQRRALAAAEASALDLGRVAVPYFVDLSAAGELRPVADGLTESLIDELSEVSGLDVLSRNAVAPYREARVPLDSVGRALKAGTVVDGAVEKVGDDVRVVVRLVDGQSGVEFDRAVLERPAAELLAARDAVAEETARLLRGLLGHQVQLRHTKRQTESLAAWTLYQRAEFERKQAEDALLEGDAGAMATAFGRADSLLVQAQLLDPAWPEPAVLRGLVAFRRSRLGTDLDDMEAWVDRGLERVQVALDLDPNDARALEVRGTLKYWHWLMGVVPERDESDALFRSARADLERAVDIDDRLASAYACLSHLYLNAPDLTAAVLAGRKAYEEDAYLADADLVIWRIASASLNLGQYREMARWCDTGRERFPGNYRFVACQLLAMNTDAVEPDVPAAWDLLAALDSLAPVNQRDWEVARARLAIGGILARADLPDSARAVLARAHARITEQVDPTRDLLLLEGEMWSRLGDDDHAIDLLKHYAAANPGTDFGEQGWWTKLRGHPRWREVAAGG